MAGNRFRYVDWTHSRYLNSNDKATSRAADDIINSPEKHLLTQHQIFDVEGGYMGLGFQAGAIVVGLGVLFSVRPKLLTYLKNAQLRPYEWMTLGGTTYVSYLVGYKAGNHFFGDSQKVKNHNMAYLYQKQLNRFEGRQILTKPPFSY